MTESQPTYDESTGYVDYPLESGSVRLLSNQAVVPQIGLDFGKIDYINARAKRMFMEFGEEDAIRLGEMIPDLASSDLDDGEIMRLARARLKLVEPGSSWFGWLARRVGGIAGGAIGGAAVGGGVGSLVPVAGNIVGGVTGGIAGAIAGAINPNIANIAKEQTFDRAAKAITGDHTIDIGGLIAAEIGRLNNDDRYTQYFDQPREERNFVEQVMPALGGAEKVSLAIGNMLADPIMFAGMSKSVGTAGAVIGEGTAVGVGGGKLFRARTSLEDYNRIMAGEVRIGDAVFRDQPLADVVNHVLRRETSGQMFVRRIHQASDQGPAAILRLFSAKTPLPDEAAVLLTQAARDGEEGVRKALVRLSDPARFGEIDAEFATLTAKADAVREQAAMNRTMAELSEQAGFTKPFPIAGDLRLSGVGAPAGSLPPTMEGVNAYRKQAESLDDLALMHEAKQVSLLHEMSVVGKVNRIPKQAAGPALSEWYAGTAWAQQTGIWEAAGFSQINAGLRAAGHPVGRTLRGVVAMNPHGTVRPDDVYASEQIARFGREMELSSQHVVGRQSASWTAADSTMYRNKFLVAQDDMAKTKILEDMQFEYATRVGLSKDQYEALTTAWSQKFRKFVTDAYYDKKGKLVTEERPVVQADLLNQIPLLDGVTIRQMGRWGPEVFSDSGRFLENLDELMGRLNSLWKSNVVIRLAWITRVVMFSEQPRLAISGMPNFLTHPFAALVAADLFHLPGSLEKIARKMGFGPEDLPHLPTSSGEPLGIVDKASRANKIFVDPKSTGSLRVGGGARSADMVDAFELRLMANPRDAKYYREGWLKLLNDHYVRDPLMGNFRTWHRATGGDRKDIINAAEAWTHTAEGRAWQLTNRVAPGQVRKELERRFSSFQRLTKDDKTIIDGMGRLTMDDLANIAPPDVLPSWVWANSFRRPGTALMDQALARLIGAAVDKMSAEPSYFLSRLGPVRYETMNELGRMASLDKTIDVRKIVEAASARDMSKLTNAERAALNSAYGNSVRKVKTAVYDLAESSRVADLARYIAPFANAWQEEITRWAMLAWDRPHIPLAMVNMWREKRSLPITVTDPATGVDYIHIPFGESITRFATGKGFNPFTRGDDGVAFPLMMPWESVNLITGNGLLPGGGPWVQMPAALAAAKKPSLRESLTALNPYGGRSFMDTVFANPLFREVRKAGEDDTVGHARVFKAVLVYQMDKHKGDMSKIDVNEVERQTRALQWVGSATNYLVGGGTRPKLPPKIAEMAEYARWLNHTVPQDVADELLLSRYGVEAGVWLQGVTRSMSGAPPSAEAEGYLLDEDTKPIAKKYGKVFWTMMAEHVKGDFDPIAYAHQIDSGDREVLGPTDFLDAARNSVAWYRQSQLTDAKYTLMTERGITSTSAKAYEPIGEWYKTELNKLYLAYPSFQAEHEGKQSERAYRRERTVSLIKDFVNEPVAQGLIGTKALSEYLQARDAIRALAQEHGIKSFTSKESVPLVNMWRGWVSGILARYPDFHYSYGRLGLEFDNVLGDE